MDREALVREMARAICQASGTHPNDRIMSSGRRAWEYYTNRAEAALAVAEEAIRADERESLGISEIGGDIIAGLIEAHKHAIRMDERERCAQEAETKFAGLSNMYRAAGNEIAAAIRALGKREDG